MSCKSWRWRGDGNLTGTSDRDWLFGGRGNNTVDAKGGSDFVWAGRGHDTIDGGDGNDWIWSGRGNDVADGGAGNDRVYAGRGHDVVDGGAGNDRVYGGRGHDVVDGGAGNDRVYGGRGHDVVDGGAGNDRVYGGRGHDILNGDAGSDKVFGGSGNDTGIYSVAENRDSKDYYNGGRGNDVLVLQMSQAEFDSEDVQADLKAFGKFLAHEGHYWKHHAFQFKAFDLTVKNWESYQIQITDSEETSKNAPPVAVDDRVSFDTAFAPIQENEPNDPNGSSLSDTAQVVERSSFRTAPSEEVGDDSLPRVSITGTIAGLPPTTGPEANDVDVFAITLQAGEKLILDIDHAFVPGSPMNAQLFLMDDSGSVLAENDNPSVPPGSTGSAAEIGGTGSVSPLDPYLEFTDSGSGGTYYVAVSTWNNDPLGSSGTFNDSGFVPGDYVLNISIDNPAPDLGALVIAADKLLENDSDVNGDALTISSVGNAVNGTVELTSSGKILFKPSMNSPGSFDYTLSDGKEGESTATVTVNGNRVIGTSSDDTITSTSEAELFVGGDGRDTFNFATGSGADTIADFALGVDVLAITDGMSVAGIQTLGNDTLVSFDTADSVALAGVSGVTDVNDLFS